AKCSSQARSSSTDNAYRSQASSRVSFPLRSASTTAALRGAVHRFVFGRDRNLRARQQKVRSIAIALMVTGTVLVAFGIYFSPPQAIKIPEHHPVSAAPQSR